MQDVVAGRGSLLLVGGNLHALYQQAVFMNFLLGRPCAQSAVRDKACICSNNLRMSVPVQMCTTSLYMTLQI